MISFNSNKDKHMKEHGYAPVFFITCMSKDGSTKDKFGFPDYGAMRTFGFYHDLEMAREALNVNNCDMYEYLYSYAIIEKMYPGIHPDCSKAEGDLEWYQYDSKKNGFFIADMPENLFYGNFALG